MSRTQHRIEVEIAMGTAATPVHQSGFRREARFIDQRADRFIRDDRRVAGSVNEYRLSAGHRDHQPRNFAGGSYSPPDHATRSSILRAASNERFASPRRMPRSSGYATMPRRRNSAVLAGSARMPTGVTP